MTGVPAYWTDLGHWQVAGASGSKSEYGGKTVTSNAYFQSAVSRGWFDQSVYFDPKHDDAVGGVTCRSLGDLRNAYDRGERLFHFLPQSAKGEEEAQQVYDGFIGQLPGKTLALWDEANDYGDTDALQRAVRRGGNEYDTKSVCISQRPTDMATDVRGQLLTFVWVGPPTGDLQEFCQRNPTKNSVQGKSYYDVVKKMHTRPFQFTVFDSDSARTYDPVPEGYA